jgi:hypothetical protein
LCKMGAKNIGKREKDKRGTKVGAEGMCVSFSPIKYIPQDAPRMHRRRQERNFWKDCSDDREGRKMESECDDDDNNNNNTPKKGKGTSMA